MMREKLEKITQEYGNPYAHTSFEQTNFAADIVSGYTENASVAIAGRLIAKRGHGKSSFGHVLDVTGKTQIYAQLNTLGEKTYALFKLIDIGDIVGIRGSLFKTHTGETTVLVKECVLLSKALRTLPEKWHGLKDIETRYRQRYIDLIANNDVRTVFTKRSTIIAHIRDFFNAQKYMEVETPMLHQIAGGAAGKPFITHHNAHDCEVYLRIAPELYLKRLLVGGFERVYEINRSFRNEGVSIRHSPEFTMLEAYCAYNDYTYMMNICEQLFCQLAREIHGSYVFEYQGKQLDFTPPWQRISFAGLFKKEFDINTEDGPDEVMRKVSTKLHLPKGLSRTQIMNITEELLEKNFPTDKPAFITDYFTWSSPLAKRNPRNPYLVDRFELFIAGIEIANAYSELNDPIDQLQRFSQQIETEEELPKKIDMDFVRALEYAMPPAAGLGIGIDRLIMILLNQPSIRDVILFPLLKPTGEHEEEHTVETDGTNSTHA